MERHFAQKRHAQLVGLGMLAAWFRNSRRKLTADHESFTTPDGRRVPFSSAFHLDKRKWDNKGLAYVRYRDGSSTRKAVIPVLERWNALLLYPTLYEGFEYSRNVFYTGAAPNQNGVQLAEFMTRRFGSRVFMVGSDYVYPYETNRIMSDLVLERGGAKVGEHYLPLDATQADYTALVRLVRETSPSFIFSTVVGEGTAMLYRAYRDAGLDPARCPIASLTTSEAEVQQMGAELAEGHIT